MAGNKTFLRCSIAPYGGKIAVMMMESKMSVAEFQGYLKRYRLNYSDVSSLIFMKTGAVIKPQSIRVYVERGNFSGAMTAAFRLLFRSLDDSHARSV